MKTYTYKADPELGFRFETYAQVHGVTRSEIIRRLIEDCIRWDRIRIRKVPTKTYERVHKAKRAEAKIKNKEALRREAKAPQNNRSKISKSVL